MLSAEDSADRAIVAGIETNLPTSTGIPLQLSSTS